MASDKVPRPHSILQPQLLPQDQEGTGRVKREGAVVFCEMCRGALTGWLCPEGGDPARVSVYGACEGVKEQRAMCRWECEVCVGVHNQA